MVSGVGKAYGVARLNVKIMINREVLIYVVQRNNFQNVFLIGLDLIKIFRLCQN